MKNTYKLYISMIFVTIVVVLSMAFFASQSNVSIKLNPSDTYNLNSGWYVYLDGEKHYIEDLPLNHIDSQSDNTTIYIVLPDEFLEEQYLLIRSSLQNITIKINGSTIYQHHADEFPSYFPNSSLWHFVKVDPNSADKILSITISSDIEQFASYFNEVIYGTTGDLYVHLWFTFGFRALIGFVMILVGIIMLVLNQFLDREISTGRIYISLFIINLGIWVVAESKLLQLILPSPFIVGSLNYITFVLMPLPITLYIRNYVTTKYKKLYLIMFYYFLVQAAMIINLQLLEILSFNDSLPIVQISVLIASFTVIILEILEYFKNKTIALKSFLFNFGIVVLFAFIEIIDFAFSAFPGSTSYGLFIILIYMIFQLFRYFININYRYRLSYELEIANKLIYIDALTGGKNRHAFEEDFEKIFADQKAKENLRLIMFDLDNFKEINDTFGHVEGDEVLKKSLYTINRIFNPYGMCYRIGGDEFACILTTKDESVYTKCLNQLREELIFVFDEVEYGLKISAGSTFYDQKKFDKPSDMLRVADYNMYTNKREKKSDK